MSSLTFKANLFKVGANKNATFPGAPTLVPTGEGSYDVDVYTEYPWTVSDDARNYIPKILLTEYKLEYASELNAFNKMIAGTVENAVFAFAGLAATAGISIPGKPKEVNIKSKLISGETETENDMLNGIGDPNDDSLNPYKDLYTTKKTGWGYILPYLGAGNMTDIKNDFTQADYKARFIAPFGPLFEALTPSNMSSGAKGKGSKSILATLPAASNIAVAGAAGAIKAEVPLSFTGTSTENIKVEFYLLNTIKPEDIRKNYEFCYLLTYQNLPNRRAINVLDSPPLYRATVIGYKTLPVCYMNELKIENVGAVRLINIGETSVKNEAANSVLRGAEANSNTVKMIPEAYKISFTLQSVFMNSQNMFVFAANPEGIITTSVATAAAPTNLEQVNTFIGKISSRLAAGRSGP